MLMIIKSITKVMLSLFVKGLKEKLDRFVKEMKLKRCRRSLVADGQKKCNDYKCIFFESSGFQDFILHYRPFDKLFNQVRSPSCADEEKIEEILEEANRIPGFTALNRSNLKELFKDYLKGVDDSIKEIDPDNYRDAKQKRRDYDNKRQYDKFKRNMSEKLDEMKTVNVSTEEPIKPWIPNVVVNGLELTYRYNTEKLPLIGRDEEMKVLISFCNDDLPFLWYAICGPAGSGKSRLAYELAIDRRCEGWTVYWLKEDEYSKLKEMSFERKDKILIVADYVLMHTKEVAEFIGKQESIRTKVRLLMLERANENLCSSSVEGSISDASSLEMQEYSLWTSIREYSSRTLYTLYKRDPRLFLFMDALSEDAMNEVIQSYAREVNPEEQLTEEVGQMIFAHLKEVDVKYRRPLFARMLVLLWARGIKCENCSAVDLMQLIFDHEMDRWKKYLKDSNDRVAVECLLEMLAIVTMNGVVTKKKMDVDHDDFCNKMNKYLKEEIPSFFEHNEMLGCSSNGEEFFYGVEPDLFGEFLVLRWLTYKRANISERLDILFDTNWYDEPAKCQFLVRFMGDYETEITNIFGNEFKNRLFNKNILSYGYMECLFDITCSKKISVNLIQKAVEGLRELAEILDLSTYTETYVRAVFNLSNRKGLEGTRECAKRIEKEYQIHRENEGIVSAYAKILGKLSIEGTHEDKRKSLHELTNLHSIYVDNEMVSLSYAVALLKMINGEIIQEKRRHIQEMKKLYDRVNNQQVVVFYVSALTHMCQVEEQSKGRIYIDEIARVYEENHDEIIAEFYAASLFYLWHKENNYDDLDRLRKLNEVYGSNKNIVESYAKSMIDLGAISSLSGRRYCIDEFERLYEKDKGNSAIITAYAKGLVNLSYCATLTERRKCVMDLKNLYEKNVENIVVAEAYAKGLDNLYNIEDHDQRQKCTDRIKEIYEKHSGKGALYDVYKANLIKVVYDENRSREGTMFLQ